MLKIHFLPQSTLLLVVVGSLVGKYMSACVFSSRISSDDDDGYGFHLQSQQPWSL